MDVGVVGVPFSGGQPKDGVQHFPKLCRERGIFKTIESLNRKVTDYGDVEIPFHCNTNPTLSRVTGGGVVKNVVECGMVGRSLADIVQQIICVT